ISLIKYGSLWLTLQNSRYDQATTSPCRLLPKLTLSTAATGVSGSVTDASLMRIAPSATLRSEEHTSELQSLMRISYDVCCLKKTNLHTSKSPLGRDTPW